MGTKKTAENVKGISKVLKKLGGLENSTRKKVGNPKFKVKIDPKVAYREYVEENKTMAQVAKEHKVHESTVSMAIKAYREKFFSNIPMLDYFKRNRADIIADKMMMIAQGITQAKVDKASVKDLSIAYDKFNTVERLERGLATQNVDVLLDTIDALTDKSLTKRVYNDKDGKPGTKPVSRIDTHEMKATSSKIIEADYQEVQKDFSKGEEDDIFN